MVARIGRPKTGEMFSLGIANPGTAWRAQKETLTDKKVQASHRFNILSIFLNSITRLWFRLGVGYVPGWLRLGSAWVPSLLRANLWVAVLEVDGLVLVYGGASCAWSQAGLGQL